jgi:hypothetical protein
LAIDIQSLSFEILNAVRSEDFNAAWLIPYEPCPNVNISEAILMVKPEVIRYLNDGNS